MSRLLAIFLCGVVSQATAIAAAQPAAQTPPAPDLPAFHRLFLPASEIEGRTWKQQYLPVDAAEFERDLKLLGDAHRGAPSTETPRLQKSTYIAQLIGEDLLVGTAQFALSAPGRPTLMPFGPCSLAIESAHWPAADKPATLALNPAEQWQLLVEEQRLDVRWSQRGQRTASGAVQFVLELPPSLVGTLELTAPRGAEIVAEGGIVTPPVEPPGETRPSTARWLVELHGAKPLSIRVVPRDTAGQRRPLTLLRQATTYEFSTRGINVAAQLRLDVHGEPLERLKIDLDPSLHLISAKSGDVPIPWSSAMDVESGNSHVILEFQEPLSGTGRVLQLSCVTPLVTGETFPLPRVLPRNVAWQEGTANLLIPAALVLERLKTNGCRQSRVTTLPAPLTGESIEIQFYELEGRIETRLAEPKQKHSLRVGHLVEVAPDQLTTTSTFAADSHSNSAQMLELPLRAGWTIDSVQAAEGAAPLTWEVIGEDATSVLRIDSGDARRFLVRAHAPLTEGRSLRASALRAFDVAAIDVSAELVSVQGVEGLEVRWQSHGVEGRDPATLAADELLLFSPAPTQMVVRAGEQLDDARLSIERERPEFSADLDVDVLIQGQTLTETFTILCTPTTSRVDRMLVHLSQRREVPVQWSLAGGNNAGEFSARRLSPGEQEKLGLPGGEVWELLLELERLGPFQLRGQRRAPFTAETPIALASVPRASNQRGKLAIRALGESGLTIHNRGLTSVPAEVLDDEHYQSARAAYHYSPSAEDFAAQPSLTLVPAAPLQASTGAWIWSLKLVSRCDATGVMSHRAFATLQTAGRRHVEVRLPAAASLVGAWIDDVPVTRLEVGKVVAPLKLELPPGKSRSRLAIHYTTPTALPTLAGQVAPAFPELDIPLVHRQWQLWLPPGHVVGDANGWLPAAQAVPLSWSERLFGPLGRGAGQHLFNPLVAADWRDHFGSGAESARARDQARLVMTALGDLLGAYRDAEELTWGQLLATIAEGQSTKGVTLLLDPAALAAAGIGPLTRMPPADEEHRDLGRRLLLDAGLVLVASPDRVLLTSALVAAGFDPRAALRQDDEPIFVARGALDMQLRSPAGSDQPYSPVALWLATADEMPLEGDRDRPIPAEVNGWRRYDFACPEPVVCTARVVHTSRMQSLAWAVLLATAGLGLWRPFLRGGYLLIVLGVLSAVALAVPASFTPLAAAAFLGTLLGFLARLTVTSPPPAPPREVVSGRGSQSRFVQPVASILLAAAVVNAAAALDAAQPGESSKESDAEPVYTVLFPVDEQRRPAGTKVFVPEPFYARLLRAAAAASGRPREWLVSRAAYEGTVSRDAATASLMLTALKARFEVNVFQSNVPVRIALPQESWAPAINTARLDGRALAPQWASESELVLGTLPVGDHVLELDLRPAAFREKQATGIDLAIPRVVQSTLKLSGAADLDGVRVLSARGRVSLDAERASLEAQLGATPQLLIRWPAAQGNDAAPANLLVDELMWVRVRPGATLLDARLKFQVTSGELRTVRLSTDPRLRLLTAPAAGSSISAIRSYPGSPQTIELDLAQPARDAVTLDVSFLVTDASGVGNLRLPRLEAIDARPSRRWLGVSVDPALQYRIQAGEDSPSVEIAKFLEAWGIGDAKPLAAFTISRGEPIWFLATQPAEPRVAVQQKNLVSVGRRSARARMEATLEISAGVLAQLSLVGPPDFKVERVSVLDQDVERVARWSVSDDGEIIIFLTTPITGRQQLILTGLWPLPESPDFEAPQWTLRSATTTRCQWEFYRQHEVLLTVNAPAEAKPPESPPQTNRPEYGFLSAAFVSDQPAPSIGLQVTENDPRVAAVSITSVRRDGERWLANVDYQVDVTQGVLDAIELEIPAQLVEPFRAEPSAAVAVSTAPATQRRVLTITPAAPIAGRHVFRLQGRIAPAPGDRLRVPDVVPLRADTLQRFVVLPNRLDAQPVAWETSRLSPAKLPAELVPRGWKPETVSTYQVQDDGFQAALKSVDRADAQAVVQLADVHLTWLPDGDWRLAATYDLLPGGATDCELQLPADSYLINATVDRLPAALVALDKARYRLTLGPQSLPQRIEILCAGSRPFASHQFELVAPRLAGTDPLQTLCTVYHLPTDRVSSLAQRMEVSASDQLLVRLNSTSRLVDLSADVLGEHLPEEISRWYGNWRQRYGSARRTLRQALLLAGRDPLNSEEAGEARSLDQKMAALDDRLRVQSATGRSELAQDLVQSFTDSAGAGLSSRHFSLKPADGPLRIQRVSGGQGVTWRWLSAGGLAVAGTVIGWRLRNRALPQVPLVTMILLVATFWWLVLSPSMWGLLALALVALTLVWRRGR